MTKTWDWMRMYIPFVYELDRYIKKLVLKRMKKKLNKR